MGRPNGNAAELRPLEDAVRSENDIAARASAARGEDFAGLTPELFVKLWPLLREPIPQGFIKSIGVVTGKPYASTGIKSVQVQIDRMNNVLTPLGWRDKVEYHENGKVAHVRVEVIAADGQVLAERESWGGVNQSSTQGNLYKGGYTNAAKIAFARLGPGHEVYTGVTDLDPDVHEETASQQRPGRGDAQASAARPTNDRLLTDDERARLVGAFTDAGIDSATYLSAVGAESTDELTLAQAFELRTHLDQHLANGAKA
jgi:hypothetical protein